jgi:hypothetical protein
MRKPWTTRPGTPWWVSAFTDIGRPLMSVVVLVLCAPGEQHLARMAGWTPELAWGMAGLLAAYAGIAAVVATVRPQGAPGKRSAVVGAILALLLAMAAQPVSHLFVTGWLSDTPRAPVWLIVTVSTVPPLVLGHLLHLAAGHVDTDGRTLADAAGQTAPAPALPAGQPVSAPVPLSAPVPVRPAASAPAAGHPSGQPVSAAVNLSKTPVPVRPSMSTAVRLLSGGTKLSDRVKELMSAGHTDSEIRDIVNAERPGIKPDSLSKSVRRARTAP